jgi:hypothetical protein
MSQKSNKWLNLVGTGMDWGGVIGTGPNWNLASVGR